MSQAYFSVSRVSTSTFNTETEENSVSLYLFVYSLEKFSYQLKYISSSHIIGYPSLPHTQCWHK